MVLLLSHASGFRLTARAAARVVRARLRACCASRRAHRAEPSASTHAAGAASNAFWCPEAAWLSWPARDGHVAKLRVVGALALLLVAKLFVVRVPFIFKRCIDALTAPATAAANSASVSARVLVPVAWMVTYGLSRALYTLLQEARYLLFTPVGQNSLRRFMRDAFEHVQSLDAAWLSQQSTGELSRVFARGAGHERTLRLLVFNVVPTALEAVLVVTLLGRRYGASFSSRHSFA